MSLVSRTPQKFEYPRYCFYWLQDIENYGVWVSFDDVKDAYIQTAWWRHHGTSVTWWRRRPTLIRSSVSDTRFSSPTGHNYFVCWVTVWEIGSGGTRGTLTWRMDWQQVDLRSVWCEVVNWIKLARRKCKLDFLNTVARFWVAFKMRKTFFFW